MDIKSEGLMSLIQRYPRLKDVSSDIVAGYELLVHCFEHGGKLLVAGNGGSAADAEHISGELMKCFRLHRPVDESLAERLISIDPERGRVLSKKLERSLPAIPLVSHEALTTAYMNDVNAEGVFAQQLFGYGSKGDVFLGISTSGNSENIINAAIVAKAIGMEVLGLTGRSGGKLSDLSDITVKVPEDETYLIQELHLPVYHFWCMMLEEVFFNDES